MDSTIAITRDDVAGARGLPPIVLLLEELSISTPLSPLPIAAAPAALVPIKLSSTRLPDEPPLICTPRRQLPEMTSPAPAVVPPTVLSVDPAVMSTPEARFRRRLSAGVIPM